MLPDNETILKRSTENPEPFVEDFYVKEHLVITRNRGESNKLMQANAQILDFITAFKVACDEGNKDFCAKIIEKIIPLLETSEINNSEFTSFWEVNDTSYSMYRKLSPKAKKHFLNDIILRYIAHRHQIYKEHGYTATTLQVKADSFAHKRSGELGTKKVKSILEGFSLERLKENQRWSDCGSFYIGADKKDKKIFDAILGEMKIRFEWGRHHKGKRPDFLIRYGDELLIVEHKHMKEAGGGQDKQIVEISEFVSQREPSPNVHYIAFLDGILFNMLLVNPSGGKPQEQNRQIRQALKKNKKNYFVNTYGFNLLMQHLVKQNTT